MKFVATPLEGAFLVELEPARDERGYFARTYCVEEFTRRGLEACLAQCSVSYNAVRGTLRGMHWQAPPHEEAKLVRCTRGALFDVIVDLRPGSPTFRRWFGAELRADEGKSLYVPKGFAHGFITLEDASEVLYQISTPYRPDAARGFRWDDPRIMIGWPLEPRIMSARDRALPALP